MNEQLHQVTLNFSDGVTHSFQVAQGANVLEAAIAADMPVLYQCRSGGCSSCICTLADGEAVTQPGASSSLLSSEYEAGQRLLCVSQANSDCTFNLPSVTGVGPGTPHEVNAFIDPVEAMASNVWRLTLALAEGAGMRFGPARSCQFALPA